MSGSDPSRVRRCGSIAEVDAGVWDRLARQDVYARHGWLQTLEETVDDAGEPVYFLLESGAELLGAAICYRFADMAPSPVDSLLFGRLTPRAARFGITTGPLLACAPLIGQGRHLLWHENDPSPDRVIEPLLDAIGEYADAAGLSLAFAKLPDSEKELLAALTARGFARTLNWPVAYLDICWDSFDDYVAGLVPGVATKVRRECAAPGKAGVEIRQEADFTGVADEAFVLMEANHCAYSDEPFGIAPGFLRTLARLHRGQTVVTVARAGDSVAGAALLLTAGACAGGPLIGVDPDRQNRRAFTYFNLALYAPIRWCIEQGIKRLYLGAGLYDMKRRRGCSVLGLAMLIRHRSGVGRIACRLLCALHRLWAGVKLGRRNVRLPQSR